MSRRTLAITVLVFASLFLVVSAALPAPVSAQQKYKAYEEGFTIIPPECINQETGVECGLNSFVQLFVNLAQVGLKILPYIAMIMLIWAGFDLITSGGNQEKIAGGKKFFSSVVIGVTIVTILAWTLTYFIVFLLTGGATIFPGTDNTPNIWEREWWGGGEVAAPLPGTGCCVVDTLGCTDNTEKECGELGAFYALSGNPQTVNWAGENQFCGGITQCQNYQFGCCVPNDANNDTCYNPNERGCLDNPFTSLQPNNCTSLDQCDPDKITGEATTTSTTGCCVTGNSCSATSNSECFGTFLPGQNCSAISECTAGCCVATDSCSNGKVNCTGTWNAAACDVAPNDQDCQVGCCIADDSTNYSSCYSNQTLGSCLATYGPDIDFQAGFASCNGLPQCDSGCCTTTASCSTGNIDGACPDPATGYNESTACTALAECQIGCCLYNNATSCVDGIQQGSCNSTGDTFVGVGSCSTYGQCTTGCCKDVLNNSGACIDGYAQSACGGVPNTFWSGQTCAAAACT